MAGQDIIHAASAAPKVLFSGQLGDVNEDVIYAPAAAHSAIIKSGSVCNTSGAPVIVNVSVLQSGQATGTATHRVISGYSLAAGDTLSLKDYLAGVCLGPGDQITAQASVTAVVDVVLSGIENS
jgi:hypothetical protein